MYWLPAIFIFVEILFLFYVDKMISYTSSLSLYKKYKDESLKEYITEEYKPSLAFYGFVGIFLVLELVYFLVGLFYPIYIISIVFILYYILNIFIDKFKIPSTEKLIKLANLKNFVASDIKFDRMLKLNSIKQGENLIWYKVRVYAFPILKIIAFIGIILMRPVDIKEQVSQNKFGFYKDEIMLVDEENKNDGHKYSFTVHVKEVDRYTNGMVKIELVNIEVTNGFDSSKYDYLKGVLTKKFSSIKKDSEIEWLESKK